MGKLRPSQWQSWDSNPRLCREKEPSLICHHLFFTEPRPESKYTVGPQGFEIELLGNQRRSGAKNSSSPTHTSAVLRDHRELSGDGSLGTARAGWRAREAGSAASLGPRRPCRRAVALISLWVFAAQRRGGESSRLAGCGARARRAAGGGGVSGRGGDHPWRLAAVEANQ